LCYNTILAKNLEEVNYHQSFTIRVSNFSNMRNYFHNGLQQLFNRTQEYITTENMFKATYLTYRESRF
jgi:hypothetical protein